jgi:hypothetical protein
VSGAKAYCNRNRRLCLNPQSSSLQLQASSLTPQPATLNPEVVLGVGAVLMSEVYRSEVEVGVGGFRVDDRGLGEEL